ncbi:MAG TPA: 2-oxoacid:acceptor oxidoreductase family protein [Armatimonadota bacterium]|jgi:pyruvate ferredoxin oxidoreductase gamma subunit
MAKLTEIRWHGRGGQGAKTAALLFGEAVLGQGKHMQAFPEYGPERMGAPVQSYNRISDEPITLHCGVTSPAIVVILDPTLIGTVDVTAGLPEDGLVIVNTERPAEEFRKILKLTGQKIFTIDASKIAMETIGRNIPNTPMMGALAKATGLLDFEEMIQDTEKKLQKKFRSKPEVIQGNLQAIRRAYDELKAG